MCNIFHHTFKMLPLYLARCETWQKWQTDYTSFNSLFYTLQVNYTVKLVKLFVTMFNCLSSIVLDNSLEELFSVMSAVVVDQSLPVTPIWKLKQLTSWNALCWLRGTDSQTFVNNSVDERKNVEAARTKELTLNIFSNNLTNYTVWLIFKVE